MKSNFANVTIILFFITLFEDQVSHCNVSRPLVTMREILATRNMQFQTLSYMHSIAKTKTKTTTTTILLSWFLAFVAD